ncbi:hypothetical protein D3C80_345100 [compost metagenome]
MQAQPGEECRQARQGPGDGRALDGEDQRRHQVEERQPGAGQHRQAPALQVGGGLDGRQAQLPEAEQQRRTQHQGAQGRAVQQGLGPHVQPAEEGQGRAELQQQGEGPRQRAPLAQAQPVDAGAFHRPGRRSPACVQPQRNGQAAEDHAQGQAGLHQQQGTAGGAPRQGARQQQVEQAQGQGAEGGAELDMPDQRQLQAEADDGRAEQHGAVHHVGLARRPAQQLVAPGGRIGGLQQLAPGEQQADAHVHQEEQHQERLGAGEQLGPIGAQAPGEADAEGTDEADQVEQAPGLEPGDGEDAGVEQGEVAEQRHMVAAAAGGEDGRGETAQGRGGGQAKGILGDGQDGGEQRHGHQQAEGHFRLQQGVQAHGGEHRQVEHGDTGALEHQAVVGIAPAQPPAEAQQDDGRQGHAGITQLDRHHHALGGIAQEEGQAEEQQDDADAQHGVAAEQPVAGGGETALEEGGFARPGWFGRRGWRLARCAGPRFAAPGIGGCRLHRGGWWLLGRDRHLPHLGRQLPDQLGILFGCSLCHWRGRLGNRGRRFFGRLGPALLHLEQALVHGLGARVETGGESLERLVQLGVLPGQGLQADGLADPQAHQAADQGTDDAFIYPGPEGQANQHEDPLHAALSRMIEQQGRIHRGHDRPEATGARHRPNRDECHLAHRHRNFLQLSTGLVQMRQDRGKFRVARRETVHFFTDIAMMPALIPYPARRP